MYVFVQARVYVYYVYLYNCVYVCVCMYMCMYYVYVCVIMCMYVLCVYECMCVSGSNDNPLLLSLNAFLSLHLPVGMCVCLCSFQAFNIQVKGKIKGIYTKGLSDREHFYKCLSLPFSDQHAF